MNLGEIGYKTPLVSDPNCGYYLLWFPVNTVVFEHTNRTAVDTILNYLYVRQAVIASL